MKIVVAPDKFKGCLTAQQAAEAIAAGIRQVDPTIEIDICPMADGGEGTVAALVASTGGRVVMQKVTGPLPRMKVDAPIGLLGGEQTAVIEMSSASGLALLPEDQRDPTRTTTYGTGELMMAAAELGAKRIILGIGGSATVDGGIGAAQAWGARFTLISGQVYSTEDRRLSGGDLERLLRVEGNQPKSDHLMLPDQTRSDVWASGSERTHSSSSVRVDTRGIEFIIACDVGNPLLGENGAARIFGPQKGATDEQVRWLEAGLHKLVEKTDCHAQAIAPGAGAAGGLGFGMMAFFGAEIRSGIEIVIEAMRLRERLAGADLCITAEGRLDGQSAAGKTPVGVARICREAGVPCIALAGDIGSGAEASIAEGITAYFSICPGPMALDQAILAAPELLQAVTANALRLFRASK